MKTEPYLIKETILLVRYEVSEEQKETRDDPPYKAFVDIKEIKHKGEDIKDLLKDEIYEEIERHVENINGIEE